MVTTYDLVKLNVCFLNDHNVGCKIPGWQIHGATNNTNNMHFKYSNIIYINEADKEFIIITINTSNNKLHNSLLCIELLNNREILEGKILSSVYNEEISKIKEIITRLDNYQQYKYYFTGYLYNAVIAEVNEFILTKDLAIDAESITFNSAGSWPIISALNPEIKFPLPNMIIYNTTSNIINIYNPQSANVFFICEEGYIDLTQHTYIQVYHLHLNFELTEYCIDHKTGEFKNTQSVIFWPYLTNEMKKEIELMVNKADMNYHSPCMSFDQHELDSTLNREFYYQQSQKSWQFFIDIIISKNPLITVQNERIKLYDHFMSVTGLDSFLEKYELID